MVLLRRQIPFRTWDYRHKDIAMTNRYQHRGRQRNRSCFTDFLQRVTPFVPKKLFVRQCSMDLKPPSKKERIVKSECSGDFGHPQPKSRSIQSHSLPCAFDGIKRSHTNKQKLKSKNSKALVPGNFSRMGRITDDQLAGASSKGLTISSCYIRS